VNLAFYLHFCYKCAIINDITKGEFYMKVLNMSEKRFNELERFSLPNNVFNTEGQMFMLEDKKRWLKKMYLLKRLYKDRGTVFSNKLFTVSELIDKRDMIGIEELVLPEKLVAVNSEIVGFTVPFVENINFQTVLDSYEFTPEQKIKMFKEIGAILEKMREVRIYTSLNDFYLNDIHENNFILNRQTGRINVVDLDSCKINYNLTFGARYLSSFAPISSVSKYKPSSELISVGGEFTIDENTEYYCYMVMILNYMLGMRITNFNIDEFYNYLTYLHSIGVSYELLEMFELIYVEKDNVNPYEYIDELASVVGKSHYNVYKLTRKK